MHRPQALRPLLLSALLLAVACERHPRASEPPPAAGASGAPSVSVLPAAPAPKSDIAHVERLTGGATADATLPMIVAIHGLGDHPARFQDLFTGFPLPARVVALQGLSSYGRGYSWFPLEDEAARAQGIEAAARAIAVKLDVLVSERPTRGKPIVTGFSQGGMLSFALAALHGDKLHAVIPISGALPGSLVPAHLKSPPVFALHGEADDRIPLAPTQSLVNTLRERGANAELRVFPGVGHTVSPEMRAELFRQLEQAIAGL